MSARAIGRAALAGGLALAGALGPSADPTTAASPKPDLVVARVAVASAPATFVEGTSLTATVASAQRHLRTTAGADAMAAFRQSPSFRSAARAQAAAAGAVVAGQPGAALAALLRAHQLEPREASHLVNAAAVASSIGLPNEALAMLDGAARLDDRDHAPMGIARGAVALTNRANALVQVGRGGEASAMATAARTLAPELSEASSNRAAADLCEGRDMLTALREAGQRDTGKQPPTPPHPLPPGTPWVDDSTGVAATMRRIPLPDTPLQAPAFYDIVRGLEAKEVEWLQARNARDAQLRSAMGAERTEPASRDARDDVFVVVNAQYAAPDLQELRRRFVEEMAAATRLREELFGSGDDPGRYGPFQDAAAAACEAADPYMPCFVGQIRARCVPAANALHGAWLGRMQAAIELARAHQAEYGRRVSGVAAHLSSDAAYELALMGVADNEHGLRGLLLQEISTWSGGLHGARNGEDTHYCLQTPLPPEAAPDDQAATPVAGPGPCRGEVKNTNLVLSLPVVTLKVNCEEVAIEASTEGWIAAFGEVKYNHRSNQITVFGGAKAEVGFRPVKGDFKSGVYVTVGMDGVEDAGLRVGPSRTVGAGPIEWNPSDTIDMSFVGAFGDGGLKHSSEPG